MNEYKLKFHIDVNDLFHSSMNVIKSRITHYFNIIFTLAASIILLYYIITNQMHTLGKGRIIAIVVLILLFPVIQPIVIYIKLLINYKNYPLKDMEVLVKDNEISISNGIENTKLSINELNSIKKYNDMLIIMYDNIHGQIIPNSAFINNEKDEFYNYINNRISNNQL